MRNFSFSLNFTFPDLNFVLVLIVQVLQSLVQSERSVQICGLESQVQPMLLFSVMLESESSSFCGYNSSSFLMSQCYSTNLLPC